ncbi:MAG TPA: hypothetical protein VJ821_13345 [Anaerolineales bacterium]|nr:hypothetical protein [Anaerolineales bacterium]
MDSLRTRIQRVIEELTGNESLLEMLDTDAATELLNWGVTTAKSLVSETRNLDDFAAELRILPRLKAIRQTMRSVGNWAAGKYVDPEERLALRDRLLQNFKLIFGQTTHLPSPEKMDELLNQVDDKNNSPHQLIVKLKQSVEEPS